MTKYDYVQQEIAKGSSYQHEILKLLCEISENLALLVRKPGRPKAHDPSRSTGMHGGGIPFEKGWQHKNPIKEEEKHEESQSEDKEENTEENCKEIIEGNCHSYNSRGGY